MNYRGQNITKISILVIVVILVSICGCTTVNSGDGPSLLVYCGAGLNEPMDEIATAFEQEHGVKIEFNYGGSGALLSQMELTKKGDVYMPGSTDDFNMAKNKSFIDGDGKLVFYHTPIIAVRKGNPENIACLNDLTRPGLKIALGDNQSNAIGKLCDKMLAKNGIKAGVESNLVTRAATVNELVTYVTTGQVDAVIIWEDLYDPENMEKVTIPKQQNIIKVIPIGVLSFSENKVTAGDFIDFVASDEGKAIFKKYGFVAYPDPEYS
ncbi:molybdate ABC transporter substrate-binding protein [Methanocella sp. CWC-04]|uniref:Molybdate ABC transporter substrate-binding protein n=1 Tax=Methanooceanicella nereidis TaxID=2052831 RepID=A0AAP2W6H4_9EURY|nr:molybdate ABC transporter substrate-binding protein [Methanocella sp. CWC-04]MCD1294284.1 molybdate ABC transporter substrate-binding protein [Methanocella sp. CWC-04]